MECSVTRVTFDETPVRTRLPFRFGAVTMTESVLLTARVAIDGDVVGGGPVEGAAADLLVPKWFDKDPETSIAADRDALRAAARDAGRGFEGAAPGRAFDLWEAVYRERVDALPFADARRMVNGFGVALVERAVLDAVCRAAGRSFFDALRQDVFGWRPAAFLPELEGWSLAADLPAEPAPRIAVRHTVGMIDPLRVADIPPQDRLEDGLPQALEEDVAAYGLRWFKIKIGQGPEIDARRLLDLARFFGDRPDVQFTLDGNEQYPDLDALAALFDRLRAESDGRAFLERLAFVEQPIHRAATFDPGANTAMARVRETAPVIIDEADSSVEAFPRALGLGYTGVSVKNCKGVFRTLLNRGLCALHDGAFSPRRI